METHTLELNRTVQASPKAVYDAFIKKAELEKWFCPEGMTVAINALDVRVGGILEATMTSKEDGSTHTARAEFKEIIPNEKLVFSWEWIESKLGTGMQSLITVTLTAVDGQTELSFVHSEFETETARNMHEDGWTSAFKQFDALFT